MRRDTGATRGDDAPSRVFLSWRTELGLWSRVEPLTTKPSQRRWGFLRGHDTHSVVQMMESSKVGRSREDRRRWSVVAKMEEAGRRVMALAFVTAGTATKGWARGFALRYVRC